MHSYTEYFKNSNGFIRLMEGLLKKYKSLGKFSGVIKINDLTNEEATALSRFLGVSLIAGEDIVIKVKQFLKIMSNSKYSDFDINILVKEYFNIELISNKDVKSKKESEESKFYDALILDNKLGSKWLRDVVSCKNETYKLIHKRYLQNKTNLKREIVNIQSLINNLPSKKVPLSIYSAKYTQDPHYIDFDSAHSILFFHALAYISNSVYPLTRESKIRLLDKYNIEIDNFSNFVITYNLLTDKEYINSFSKNSETLILNLQNIMNINSFNGINKKVFIFENPSILSEIMANGLDISVIITSGFINLSVYLLLDKLVEGGNKLYYNGDFDPEGLLIANKLKEKYDKSIEFICYTKDDYYNCISHNIVTKKRLNKLQNVNVEELDIIKHLLICNNKAAYQENNKERIIKAINEI